MSASSIVLSGETTVRVVVAGSVMMGCPAGERYSCITVYSVGTEDGCTAAAGLLVVKDCVFGLTALDFLFGSTKAV